MVGLIMAMTFPNWSEFTPAKAAADLPRELEAAERAVDAVEAREAKGFEDFIWALDDAGEDLNLTWRMVSHMTGVMNSEEWRKVEEDFQPKMVEFGLRVGQSKKLYATAKRLAAVETDATRRRILEDMVRGAELAGVALEGEKKDRYNEISQELAKLGMDFANEVIDATKAFTFEKNGTTYTIDDGNYFETMKHCDDREVRERLYRARSTRAPANTNRMERILALRREKAALLGFGNFAELSLDTKCAPSVPAVMKMIDQLDAATKTIAEAEDRELAEFAGVELQPWDRAYYTEKLREKKYSYSDEELKKHLELEKVLAGLFRMTKFLYDVDIVEMKGADKPSVWHPDVRFFEVREQGRAIAYFYLDPYVRPGQKQGGAWMNEFYNRDGRRGELPLALLVLNNRQPDADGRCYMPYRELETVFHEFGHATQCMLTRIEEPDAAGISLVEWDAVEVASQFNEFWCLDDRTGIEIPAELKAKVKAAKNYRSASFMRRQLAFAKLDMLLHCDAKAEASPRQAKEAVFDHFGVPHLADDRFLCAFTHIFCGGYAAGYYGYKWAEVMCADCYGAFEEAGLSDDAAVKRVGRRYRDTVLALGGSKSALEVFREFRGRDPDIQAHLRQQGLAGNEE